MEDERKNAEAAAVEFEAKKIVPLETKWRSMAGLIVTIRDRQVRLLKASAELKEAQPRFDALLRRCGLKSAESEELGTESAPTIKKLSTILSHELGAAKNRWSAVSGVAASGDASLSRTRTRLKFEVYRRLKMDPATKDPEKIALFGCEMKKELEPYEAAQKDISELAAHIREIAGDINFLSKVGERLAWIRSNALSEGDRESMKQFQELGHSLDPRGALRSELRRMKEAAKAIQARIWIEKNKSVEIKGGDVTGSLRNDVDTGPG